MNKKPVLIYDTRTTGVSTYFKLYYNTSTTSKFRRVNYATTLKKIVEHQGKTNRNPDLSQFRANISISISIEFLTHVHLRNRASSGWETGPIEASGGMTGVLCKTHVCVRRNDSAGQRGWWRLAWNCIIRLGTSRISMSCIFHEARSRGGNHIAFGSPDAVPSLSLLPLSPSRFLLPPWQRATPVFSASSFVFSRVDRFSRVEANFDFNETKDYRNASLFWAMTRDQFQSWLEMPLYDRKLWNGVIW